MPSFRCLFVDEGSIAELNSRFLGKDGPTDVLAFPIDEEPIESGRSPDSGGTGPGMPSEPEDMPVLLGDIVICPAVAYRNAPEHAGTYDDELALLVVHGLLHLMGMDHQEDEEAEEMEAKERELLARHYAEIRPEAWKAKPAEDGDARERMPPGGVPARPGHSQTGDGKAPDHSSSGPQAGTDGTAGERSNRCGMVATSSFNGTDVGLLAGAVVLIVLSAVFALSETAITRISKVKAVSLVEEKRRGAVSLLRVVEHADRNIPVILFALEICTLVAATIIGVVANEVVGPLGVVLATAFEIVVIFIFAELAPKIWAVQHTERAALLVAPFLLAVVQFAPLRWVTQALIKIANIVLPGKGLKEGPYVTEEELLAMADTAADEAVIEREERKLIHSIIDFGDTVAREVMVPRPDMVTVSSEATVGEAGDIASSAGVSRVPVYGSGIDDIVGVVYVKDMMRAEREGTAEEPVTRVMRQAQFVPESKRIAEVMREMQAGKQHLAIVVDEYGGTAGLITLEDVLEELVGEISDEYDVDRPRVEFLDDGQLQVDASLSIDEVNELTGFDLPEGDWDTVGGFLYHLLGHVPDEGEAAVFDGHRLVAEKVNGRRIARVLIGVPTPPEPVEAPHEAAEDAGGQR